MKLNVANQNIKKLNWNRFAFNGNIWELNTNSELIYLLSNQIMSVSEAKEQCILNFEMGNAPHNTLFIISHDFEGEIPDQELKDGKFYTDNLVNYLTIDKLTKQINFQMTKIYQILTYYKNEAFIEVLQTIDEIFANKYPLPRELNFNLTCLKAEAFSRLGKFKRSREIINTAKTYYNSHFTNIEKIELGEKRIIRTKNDEIVFWDSGILNYDASKLRELEKNIQNESYAKIKK